MIELRDYQRDACDAAMDWLASCVGDPVIVIPTGGGKTPVIAELCRRVACEWTSRVLVVSHVKELISQSASTLRRMIDGMDVGIYSASLNRKDAGHLVTVAQIQSLARAPIESVFGDISLMIVDEAHLIPDDDDSQYRSVIARLRVCNPAMKVIGLTATPYRCGTGTIVDPLSSDNGKSIFSGICYDVGVRDLLANGYLSPLFAREPASRLSLDGVRVIRGEYDSNEIGDKVESTSDKIASEIATQTLDRNSVLIFCSNIQSMLSIEKAVKNAICEIRQQLLLQAKSIWDGDNIKFDPLEDDELMIGCDWLMDRNETYELGAWFSAILRAKTANVTGDTDQASRDKIMRYFTNGEIKFLFNVGVATTGFDAPNVDCVVLLRATKSPGLYYQMCGRGLRKSPKKKDCLLLDFGGNVRRHGPIDLLNDRNKKPSSTSRDEGVRDGNTPTMIECAECATLTVLGQPCPRCRAMPTMQDVSSQPCSEQPISTGHDGPVEVESTEWHVMSVRYSVHRKKNASPDKPRTLRVDYDCVLVSDEYPAGCDWAGLSQMEIDLLANRKTISEWICVEHDGFARKKAVKWWRSRSAMVAPNRAIDAMQAGSHGLIGRPTTIWTVPDGEYTRIESVDGLSIPRTRPSCPVCEDTRPRVIMQGRHGEIDTIICRQCDHVYGDATTDDVDRWGVWDIPPSGEIVCDSLTTLADGSDAWASDGQEDYEQGVPF